jgi:hypothetical protein
MTNVTNAVNYTYAPVGDLWFPPTSEGETFPQEWVELCLTNWLGLALQPDKIKEDVPYEHLLEELKDLRTLDQAYSWAREVQWRAKDAYYVGSPNLEVTKVPLGDLIATCDEEAQGLVLTWSGTFTPQRWMEVSLFEGKDRLECSIKWDTGTGKTSNFLGWLQEMTDKHSAYLEEIL